MRSIWILSFAFISLNSFADTNNLRELMTPICESLGTNEGVQCVEMQRKMGQDGTYLDANGASVCALVWRWGSRSGDSPAAGNLTLSCLQQVRNKKISTEVKDTCDRNVYESQGSIATIETIRKKVDKMMSCIRKIAIPVKT
jgi:hypothetical protein